MNCTVVEKVTNHLLASICFFTGEAAFPLFSVLDAAGLEAPNLGSHKSPVKKNIAPIDWDCVFTRFSSGWKFGLRGLRMYKLYSVQMSWFLPVCMNCEFSCVNRQQFSVCHLCKNCFLSSCHILSTHLALRAHCAILLIPVCDVYVMGVAYCAFPCPV